MESVGAKLKTLRKGRGLTQIQLSEALNLSRASISNYERGARCPSFSELRRISEYFGVSVDYFGVDSTDESFELLARARRVLCNAETPKEEKENIYREIMKMYLEME